MNRNVLRQIFNRKSELQTGSNWFNIIFLRSFFFINLSVVLFLSSLFLLQLGKSVVAKGAIPKGTLLSLDMFAVKVAEPKGIPPENMQQLVGKKIKVDVDDDDSILADMIE